MEYLTTSVEENASNGLLDKLAMVFDLCSGGDTHYVATSAVLPLTYPTGYACLLLLITLIVYEYSLNTDEHYAFLKFVLYLHQKSIENLVAIAVDNTSTHKTFLRWARYFLVATVIAIAKHFGTISSHKQTLL